MRDNFEKKNEKINNRTSFFSSLDNLFINTNITESVIMEYWRNIVFIFLLGLMYVANTQIHQRINHKIVLLQREVSYLKFTFVSFQSKNLNSLRKSIINEKIINMGFKLTKVPPFLV